METSCCINLGPVGTPQVFTDVVSVQAAKHSGVMAAQSVSSSGHCLALSPESSDLFSGRYMVRYQTHLGAEWLHTLYILCVVSCICQHLVEAAQ